MRSMRRDRGVKNMNEIVVCTPIGDIVVTKSTDSDYPGVYIDIRRPGCDCDAPLAMVEYTDTESDLEAPAIITRVWNDVRREEYETRVVHEGVNEYFDDSSNKGGNIL